MSKISLDSETPAEGQQIITASAFIHHNFDGVEKVFLPRRSMVKKFLPGAYELVGGHIDFGEDIVEGLKREALEELGMRITVGDPIYAFTYENKIKGSHSIEVIYFGTFLNPIDEIKISPDDHLEFGWFAENDLDGIIYQNRENDDPEVKAIRKGFALLSGSDLDSG